MSTHTKVVGVVVDYNWDLKTLSISGNDGRPTVTLLMDFDQVLPIEDFVKAICGYKERPFACTQDGTHIPVINIKENNK